MMQTHLRVGPISSASDGCSAFYPSSVLCGCNSLMIHPWSSSAHLHRHSKSRRHRRLGPVVVASVDVNGEQDHYAVLGVARNATSADIKGAYRLLARKYHPDVSKHSQAGELFMSIHHAYEILSNEVTRNEYDRALRLQGGTGRSFTEKRYSPEFDVAIRFYRWDELRRKTQQERFWERESSAQSETEEDAEEGTLDKERGPFSEVLKSAIISLFLLRIVGPQLSLTFSSLVALFDRKLDAGYKVGYLIAWVLGGGGGILLTLCLQFASWVFGKTSSSMAAVVVVVMWVGSIIARHAPIPQGALLALLYMSIKLQGDLN